ncbi:MAG: hypothetical protein CBB67_017850 [Alteromonadaceae bacterium TMED7]|uniref:Uncharacterized protein n=1 Tax=Alteromonas alba TaxID=2079529 RepID=A0A2S9VFC5_9ALTE|nr:hypothetical protein [Alteromonas alba]MAJ69341.1 hypothetical protein [Alteromonadaceae bacterium]MCP4864430.1 hypothetical protein [Alteromonas sp.]PRO75134.1 hypothetical protein C6Y40_02715 [Alteromonas alba]RPH15293.1 MAG: hypothetical protein CBB67_017850 [Alteromonadaceae bacterium TMED7]|tara:strand:+ start:2736 stop:3140 length:405 start_codon:yes stop_codon:yes gene_type:complete
MEPDYKNYSVDELCESLDSIDKQAYPERVESIKAELKLKGYSEPVKPVDEALEQPEEEQKPLGPISQIVAVLVAILFSWFAFSAIQTGSISGRRGREYTYESSPMMFLFLLSVDLLLVVMPVYAVIKSRWLSKP